MKVAAIVPCYNNGTLTMRAVGALIGQSLPDGYDLEIIVVDDGSDDGSTAGLEARLGTAGRLLRLAPNQGRCVARNAGAAMAADADLLLFVDGDCIAAHNLVAAHVGALSSGGGVSYGETITPGDSFWGRLQQDVAARRRRRFRRGGAWAFTTANVAIQRHLFAAVGGFDLAFNRHGFEDRDLFVRLESAGVRSVFSRDAKVVHEDRVSLASVSRKLGDAGFHAAHVFRAKHPETYARMAYGRLDCSTRPWLLAVDRFAWPLVRKLAHGDGGWLERRWLPFAARAMAARALYGLCFLHGTAQRARGQSRQESAEAK